MLHSLEQPYDGSAHGETRTRTPSQEPEPKSGVYAKFHHTGKSNSNSTILLPAEGEGIEPPHASQRVIGFQNRNHYHSVNLP